jgi:hypothetical protein
VTEAPRTPPLATSMARLRARIADIPGELERAVATGAEMAPFDGARPVVATGAGGSEGPARVLAAALRANGRPARFEPLSAFAADEDVLSMDPCGSELVVVSQGLSPNARIALRCAHRFARATVLTSVSSLEGDARDDGWAADTGRPLMPLRLMRHGPTEENGLLVRVVGPAAATLAALRLAGYAPPPDLADHYRRSFDDAQALLKAAPIATEPHRDPSTQTLAFLTAGHHARFAFGFRWKMLEACGVVDPPVWDVLQFAHGPFQQIYERPMLLCALERPGDAPLFDRLEALLVRERHRLLRFRATLPSPWSFFEHDAHTNALALALLELRPVELERWPGQGADGPLYEFTGERER